MSTLCLGPICVPIWQLLALMGLIFRPLYRWLARCFAKQDKPAKLHSDAYQGPQGQLRKEQQAAQGLVSPSICGTSWAQVWKDLQLKVEATPFLKGQEEPVFILIKYGAEWCGPCRKIEKQLQTLRFCYKYVYVHVDVDDAVDMSAWALPFFELLRWDPGKPLEIQKKNLGLPSVNTVSGANMLSLESLLDSVCGRLVDGEEGKKSD